MKINPNCSEVVFELPSATREDALAELAKIGVFEFSVPSGEFYQRGNDPEERTSMLGDVDNQNLPDFQYRATLMLYPSEGAKNGVELAVSAMIKYLSKKWDKNGRDETAYRALGALDADDADSIAGVILKSAGSRLTADDIEAIDGIATRPYFAEYGVKPSQIFLDRDIFSSSPVDRGLSKKKNAEFMKNFAAGIRGGLSCPAMVDRLAKKYPALAKKRFYIFGSDSSQHQLFKTMHKIAEHFHGEWNGYGGGGTGSYEDWIEDVRARKAASEMLDGGKPVGEVIAYLESEMPYSSESIVKELGENGSAAGDEMPDVQSPEDKAKREKYFVPAAGKSE